MKKKLLIYESGFGKGGSRRSLLSWLDLLSQDNNIEIILLCGHEGWFTQQVSIRKIRYQVIPEPSGLAQIRHSMLNNPLVLVKLITSAVPWIFLTWLKISTFKVDGILLTHPRDFIMLFPLVLKYRKNSVIIPQTTDWGSVPLAKQACQVVNEVWAISKTVGDSIAMMGISWNKIRVLPLIFVCDRSLVPLSKSELRRQLKIPESAKVLGITGTIRVHKGQREALEVFALVKQSIPDAFFVVIGNVLEDDPIECEYFDSLMKRVSELGVSDCVLFLGWREDAHQLMSAFDVYLMPSQSTEGVPRVILEALESSLPVIGSDIPAIRELVEDREVGFLAPQKDKEKWAEFTIHILNDASFQNKLSTQARIVWQDLFSDRASIPIIKNAFHQFLQLM